VAGGLVALLDDVAVLARAAAASLDDVAAAAGRASVKAAGVVVDDTAVTPQYVHGLAAEREIPIVKKIAIGSLRNKLLFILPAIMLLSEFADVLLTPLLMLGGAYLCFEGAEKVWGRLRGHGPEDVDEHAMVDEGTIISGAVRTDFILSAEIMVIALNEVSEEPFVSRLVILAVVALAITVLVYGVVGLIVKMDDAGLRLAESPRGGTASFGRGLVSAMPKLLSALTVVGTAAMLWVGGHILLVGTHELHAGAVYDWVHDLEHHAHEATGSFGGVVGWSVNTLASGVIGLAVGALVVLLVSQTLHRDKSH
jgi:predicted DNA repair protein MutK